MIGICCYLVQISRTVALLFFCITMKTYPSVGYLAIVAHGDFVFFGQILKGQNTDHLSTLSCKITLTFPCKKRNAMVFYVDALFLFRGWCWFKFLG